MTDIAVSKPAFAYLGPGAGLGMIGSLLAVVAAAIVVILGLVIYPVRLLRKRWKAKKVSPKKR